MRALSVSLGDRSYPVLVGQRLVGEADTFATVLAGRQVLLVTNEVVGPLWLKHLRRAVEGREVVTHVLADGEEHKTLDAVAGIFELLAERGFHRDCTVLALGGGVVGDVAGFAAACWHRGVAFVQVPTTLLAQVDAAVGGKTGVNLAAGKNLVGAFHQPRAVVADVTTLSTLGEREFRAGLGEVIKYGLGLDAELFEWLEEAMPSLLQRDSGALEDVVYWCCALKAGVVAEDERESGRRMLLNLGHTFGHAMETATGYGAWLHGEAVAAGLVAAGRLARRLGRLSDGELERLEQLVAAAGLPADPPPVGSALIRHYMDLDKKIAGGRLRLVLPRGIGAAEIAEDVHEALVAEVLAAADVP